MNLIFVKNLIFTPSAYTKHLDTITSAVIIIINGHVSLSIVKLNYNYCSPINDARTSNDDVVEDVVTETQTFNKKDLK